MSLKLEVGKYFKTRDGRKAGPLQRYVPHDYKDFIFRDEKDFYTEAGVAWRYEDLVAEWVEEHDESTNNLPIGDELVVARFNELVKAGRVQFCTTPDGTGYYEDQDAPQRLKPLPCPTCGKVDE